MASPRTLELLEKLVAFPTVSRNSNIEFVDFARGLLIGIGFEVAITSNGDGKKANLYATLGPRMLGGVLLSGHTDVVPVDGQNWSSDPFRLASRGDKFFARGACDMKGFIASALAAAELASERQLRRPLHLALSYDEEVGCVGVRKLIEHRKAQFDRPALCIVGEPTNMRIAVGHKGKVAARVSCVGKECHSAHAPEGVNAIYLAVDMIAVLRKEQEKLISTGSRDADYAIPYSTIHVGTIVGGTALNIVPKSCDLDFEIRNLPEDDPSALLDHLREQAHIIKSRARAQFAGADVAIEIVNSYPGLATNESSEVVRAAQQLAHEESAPTKIAFGTEGGLFNEELATPTVICGPGDIRQAHQPDEYIVRDQLAKCDAMLSRLVDELC